MHTMIKVGLEACDARDDVSAEEKAKAKEALLSNFRLDTIGSYLFDENGQFIDDFSQVPKGMARASYADIVGGHSSEVYEAIMGRAAKNINIQLTNKKWMESHYQRSIHALRLQSSDGAQNPQMSDEDVVNELVWKSAVEDPITIRHQNELRQAQHELIDMQKAELQKRQQDLAALQQTAQVPNTQTQADEDEAMRNKESEVARLWIAFQGIAADAADYQDRQYELQKAQKELIKLQQDAMVRVQMAMNTLQPQQGQDAQAQNARAQLAQARAQLAQANPELAAAQRREDSLEKSWGGDTRRYARELANWEAMKGALRDEAEKAKPKTPAKMREVMKAKLRSLYADFQDREANSLYMLILQKVYDMACRLFTGAEYRYPNPEAGQYSEEEEELYSQIENAAAQNKLLSATTMEEADAQQKVGLNGEPMANGIIFNHVYSILGVEQREVRLGGGATHIYKFIKMRNPWGTQGTRYVVENGKMRAEDQKADSSGKQGVFLMELHDFGKYFSNYYEQ